jgi:hypothetical protein
MLWGESNLEGQALSQSFSESAIPAYEEHGAIIKMK